MNEKVSGDVVIRNIGLMYATSVCHVLYTRHIGQ